MFNQKVLDAFEGIQKRSSDICREVDTLMGDFLGWAGELKEAMEKVYGTSQDTTYFLLPKTPSEKRTRNRRARKASASKCSVAAVTLSQNEVSNLEVSRVSPRTRGSRRAAAKASVIEATETEKKKEDEPNATFVLPKASTRTKPVLKIMEPVPTVSESERNENQVVDTSENSEKELSFKSVASSTGDAPQRKTSNRSSQQQQSSPKDIPVTHNDTPTGHVSNSRISRTSSAIPPQESSKGAVPRSPTNSPSTRSMNKNTRSNSQSGGPKISVPETCSIPGNETVTIKKDATPKGLSTYIVVDETFELTNDNEKTPVVAGDELLRLPRTSTPAIDNEKTPVINEQDHEDMEIDEDVISSTRIISAESNGDGTLCVNADNVTQELSKDAEAGKKKGKTKSDEEMKENVEETAGTMRITRTKSKALQKMMEENEAKQVDLTSFAKKLVLKAKRNSMKKSQLDDLTECISLTPTKDPGHSGSKLPFGNHMSLKYHLLVSTSKKLKALPTVPMNSALKMAKGSGNKDRTKATMPCRDGSVESLVRTATKPPKDDPEKESKLRSKKEKEEEAALKRQNVIKAKQEELKRKNELKHQMAMKQREKMEQEKYQNMIQLEKEKEERHKLILQERQNKLKEEAFKKKMLTQQKIAETMERRRIEEEARLAKLKEMEAEEQRLALEKQKEQERQEKRAQERLAEKKAREEYEQKMKQELEAERLRAEKLLTSKKCLPSTSKHQSASKRPGFLVGLTGGRKEWDYKPRHENDYGLEGEDSELESDDEKPYPESKPPTAWAKEILSGKAPVLKTVSLDMLCEYMQCHRKSPDIHKMFEMTPSKRIKRSSSAIWNTPSS